MTSFIQRREITTPIITRHSFPASPVFSRGMSSPSFVNGASRLMMNQRESCLSPTFSPSRKGRGDLFVEETSLEENDPLVKEAADSNENIGKVIYMGICFILIFSAASAQSLVGEIYHQLGFHSLGVINLMTQSVTAGIGVLLVPGLIKTWQYKTGVIVGSIGTILVLLAGVLTTSCNKGSTHSWCVNSGYVYASNIICSVIQGFTAPILWLCVNRYITGCSNPFNRGKFMGIFSAMYSVASITGNLSSSLTIKKYGQFDYYLAASIAACIFTCLLIFAPHVEKYVEENQEESAIEKSVNIIKLALSKRMSPLLLYMFYIGLLGSAVSGFQYKIVLSTVPTMSETDQNSLTAIILLVQGAIQTVGSYAGGKMADVFRTNPILYLFNLFQGLALITGLFSYLEGSLGLSYVMAAFWGFGNYGAYTLVYVVIAQDFEGSIEAYAVPQLMAPLASAIGYGLCIVFGDKIVAFLIFLFAVLVVNQMSTFFYKSSDDERKNKTGQEESKEEDKKVIKLQTA